MDLRDVYGYGKIIRNDEDFPSDCTSDDQRKALLNLWIDKIYLLSLERDNKTKKGIWGRRQQKTVWYGGKSCPDGSGGAMLKISPRHNYGIVKEGSFLPSDIMQAAYEYAAKYWNKPRKISDKVKW